MRKTNLLVFFDVSDHLEQFERLLFFCGKINSLDGWEVENFTFIINFFWTPSLLTLVFFNCFIYDPSALEYQLFSPSNSSDMSQVLH